MEACAASWLLHIDMAAAVGIFSGATTNTPALGAAQEALKQVAAGDPARASLPALGYAVAQSLTEHHRVGVRRAGGPPARLRRVAAEPHLGARGVPAVRLGAARRRHAADRPWHRVGDDAPGAGCSR